MSLLPRRQLTADSSQHPAMILFTGYFFLLAASCLLLAESPVSPFLPVPASFSCAYCLVPSRTLGWPRNDEGQNGRDINQGEKAERLINAQRRYENQSHQETAQERSQKINTIN